MAHIHTYTHRGVSAYMHECDASDSSIIKVTS